MTISAFRSCSTSQYLARYAQPAWCASTASPAKAATTSWSSLTTTLTMYASFAMRAARSMSRFIGLPSSTPMRAFGSSMNSAQWLPSTVTRLHTPGRMLLRPPEKPAKKCGSMNPSDTTRSAFATNELTTRRAPEGSGPRSVSGEESQSWTAICSREAISSPSL